MAGGIVYRDARECYLAVLEAIDTIDVGKEWITDMRIWKFAPEARSSSPWAWKVGIGRKIDSETFNASTGLHVFNPQEKNRDPKEEARSKARWREDALEAYETAIKLDRAEQDGTLVTVSSGMGSKPIEDEG